MKVLFSTLLLGLLTACGGGGDGSGAVSGPVASTLSFPLRQGVNTLTANGESATFTAIGTSATQATNGLCSGTYTFTSGGATTSATFRGQAALSANSAASISFTNCTPASNAESGTDYYDTNYVPIGDVNASSGKMGLWQTAPNIPTTVRVNDVIIVGTKNHFTDTTGTTNDGRSDMSVVVEADTSTTAVINQIVKRYNAAGQLTSTTQGRSRIDAGGTLTRLSIDIQYATTSTVHLVFRR
ncbi:MAG: hypothetical protein RIR09_1671 [Pseudomonadota bacterium]|jgi:hypothetical protein